MDNKGSWKRFQRLRFDSKKLSRSAKRVETVTTRHARRFVTGRLASLRDIRRHVTLWLAAMTVLIAAVAVQTVWYQEGYRTHAAVAGGTYAEAMLGPVDTLDPLYAQSSAEQSASRLIFSSLYDYDQTGHLRDDLATGMKVDKTGKNYTVSLRSDAKWQDDTSVTADDVVFTVNLMKNPSTRAVMQSTWSGISVKAIDEHTVRFTLPAANSPFPYALTFAVLPQHILGSIEPGALRENTFSISPVGSGPFKLRLLQTVGGDESNGHKIVHLSAWKNYYRGAPKLSRFELHAYASSDGILRALKVHDVNAALDINGMASQLPPGLVTNDYPINSGVYALMNTASDTLKDVRVRQALQVGTDTSAVRHALRVKAPSLDLPFLPSQISTTSLPKKPAYSQAKARAMLAKDGWKLTKGNTVRTKKKQTLTLRLVTVKDDQYHRVVEELAKQWRALGVGVQITEFDPDATNQSFTQTVLQPRDYDVLVNELAIGADPDVFAYWYSSEANPLGRNYSNYRSDITDDALLSARQRSEVRLRDRKYTAFATQWLRDAPAIGLYQSVMEYTHSKQTEAFSPGVVLPGTTDRYSNVLYWTAEHGQVYKTP